MGHTGVRYSRHRKRQATLLRARGWSVKRIAKYLGIAVSTASLWVRSVPLTREQEQRLRAVNGPLQGRVAHRLALERASEWKAEALGLWRRWHSEPLFMLGLGIYWGEGTKAYRCLSVTNSDPDIIKTWVCWCRKYIPDAELHLSISLPEGVLPDKAADFWKTITGVQRVTVFRNRKTARTEPRRRTRNLLFGTARVRVCRGSAEWHTKMMEWLKLASKAPLGETGSSPVQGASIQP